MFKKIIYIFLPIIIISVFLYMLLEKNNGDVEESPPPVTEHDPLPNDEDDALEVVDVHKVYALAKKGMIDDLSAIAGTSQYDEIVERYGEPERVDETSVGDYAVYDNLEVSIGFRDNVAFDLRSYEQELHDIHYQEILEQLGEPDIIKYYEDEQYDQIILIYNVNESFELKWILDKPSMNEENPSVHHLSVVAKAGSEEIRNPSTPDPVESMTLDEKLGQLIFAGISGVEVNEEAESLIKDYKVGGIIFYSKNMNSPGETVAYINNIKTLNQGNRLPLFFGIDQEGGRVAKLPGELVKIPANLEIGQVNNLDFSLELGSVLGQLVKAYGFNMNFAPVLDVNSNPNNPVIGDRSFGDNVDIVSELGIQTMYGLQRERVIPTIKHFPGHGDTSVDSHFELPTVNKSLAELERLELIPFQRAIAVGADVVMIAHLLLPQIDSVYPSSLSEEIITGLLRNKIGFDGVVITDDLTMEAITKHFDIGKAAVQSIKAGSDIVMVAHEYDNVVAVFNALKNAVASGELLEERINESVTRILDLKDKYELDNSLVDNVNIAELNQKIKSVLEKYME